MRTIKPLDAETQIFQDNKVIAILLWPLLLTWYNLNPGMDK